MSKKLYVGNIPFSTTDDELKQCFEPYGATSANVIMDKATGRSRGFGFVEVADGEKAIADRNGFSFNGRPLVVNEAREREPRERNFNREPRERNFNKDRRY